MPTILNVPLIKKLRLHFKMTQGDVALQAGIHKNSITFLEYKGTGTLHLANKLADVFECLPIQLMVDTKPSAKLPKNYDLVEDMRHHLCTSASTSN